MPGGTTRLDSALKVEVRQKQIGIDPDPAIQDLQPMFNLASNKAWGLREFSLYTN
jgi:hypothetical protein